MYNTHSYDVGRRLWLGKLSRQLEKLSSNHVRQIGLIDSVPISLRAESFALCEEEKMLKSRELQADTVSQAASTRATFANARIVALIAAAAAVGGSIGSATFNYFFTEKERTEIQQRALAVQQASLQVSEAAQRTSDEVKQITLARLELEKEIHLLNTARSNFRDEIARVGGMNDSRRTENDSVRTRVEMAKLTLPLESVPHSRVHELACLG